MKNQEIPEGLYTKYFNKFNEKNQAAEGIFSTKEWNARNDKNVLELQHAYINNLNTTLDELRNNEKNITDEIINEFKKHFENHLKRMKTYYVAKPEPIPEPEPKIMKELKYYNQRINIIDLPDDEKLLFALENGWIISPTRINEWLKEAKLNDLPNEFVIINNSTAATAWIIELQNRGYDVKIEKAVYNYDEKNIITAMFCSKKY